MIKNYKCIYKLILKIVTIFLPLCYSNFLFAIPNKEPKNFLVSENMKITTITDEQGLPLNVGLICSQTFKNKNQIIFCDYGNVYLMDIKTGKTKILNKPENVDVWNPTGVKWCADNQRLYIANYNGHDILIVELENKII
ncbi:MAG: hypothetical protein RCG15_01075 [Candidatus Rickettsia vulgarisii]